METLADALGLDVHTIEIFSDPASYFYIFWFPQYLKSARGFDIASIGKFAWIPILTADAGNLLGGACAAALLLLRDRLLGSEKAYGLEVVGTKSKPNSAAAVRRRLTRASWN